jgi:hypothetical protein
MAGSSVSGNSSPSKSLMWMAVGFFACVGVLLVGGFALVHRVVRTVGLTAATGNKDTVYTPSGSFRLEKQDSVGPGLPVYPHGSLELPDATAAATTIQQAQNGVSVAVYHTADDRDFVDNWYSQHLGPEFKRREVGEALFPDIFKEAGVSDSDTAFAGERGAQIRIVALSLDGGGTKISLIRVDRAPAPTSSGP